MSQGSKLQPVYDLLSKDVEIVEMWPKKITHESEQIKNLNFRDLKPLKPWFQILSIFLLQYDNNHKNCKKKNVYIPLLLFIF